ncbi:complement C4-B-like isoform X2 [Heptranchias perlo]|uniref:complement C4-B-like isoform X2 n=1 Tax=Heptranchias perlo TaxID=212740 RepID=UPI003559890E
MGKLLFLLWFSVVIPAAEQSISYLITAPNIIHAGVKESVAIQLEGAKNPVVVTVYLSDMITRTECSQKVVFELNAANNYHQIKDIIALPDRIKHAHIWLRKDKYISLVAECNELFPERKMVPVLLSSKKGYIFIQTDKPIYTPNEVVRYRIFTLDHYMRPVSENIKITIYNSRNVQFPSLALESNKVINRHIKIPDIAEPGIWRIEAVFSDSPMSMVSAQFEVKEFVLPSFKVEVKAEEMFYLITRDEFKFKILAIHTYGQAVEGMAYVRFGIIDVSNKNTYLRGLEQQLQVKNGVVESVLATQKLLDKIKPLKSMNDLVGHHLYMAVTVFETSSGEMEELELSGIKFVSSPYVIDLSKTSSYFIPKVSFDVLVRVTYPDGVPASRVPVKLGKEQPLNTQENGYVLLTMQPPPRTNAFEIKVTAGDGAPGREISEAKKTVHLYQSKSESYLHLNVPNRVFDPDSLFSADIKAVTPTGSGDVKYYNYLIISKGKVLQMDRILKTELTKLSFPLTIAMVPTFRLVLYYYITIGGKTEMVANSAWIDVKDVCEGKITIKDMPKEYTPGSTTKLWVETEDSGCVYIAVVDTAIYILNKKNKLTPNKVFEEMNSYDLGCSFGGGANSVNVFMDAGLTFISNVDTSVVRDGYSCKTDGRRTKRSLEFQDQYKGKLSHYTNSTLKKCCEDGIVTIPMKRTCEERAKRVRDEECRKVFLTCCDYGVELRNNQSKNVDAVGRSSVNDDDGFFDESSLRIRSNFPQTWHWRSHLISHAGEHQILAVIPDSITTWEIQAIGMFENKGFCVAEPKMLKVFRLFFVSLRLPYSVKRNEQLEVRAILYNYLADEVEVKIYMKAMDGLCSPASSEQHPRTVTVRGNSAYPIYFSVVPLIIGNIPITVVAFSKSGLISDGVTKNLKVLGEGVIKTEERSIAIDPRVKSSYQISEELPSNIVPDTDSYLFIRARGEVMGETVQNCLTPEGINRLIRVPKGCAEQTSIYMAPTVFAVRYLDKSEQWLNLKAERKDEALQNVEAGYKRILEYKKEDGSYGAWRTRPSSTWLTAFVVKILSIVRSQIEVKDEHIQQSALYLVKGQRATGYFVDPHPVIHRDMQGGIGGLESKISTTAFVTIALVHSLPSFYKAPEQGQEVKESITRAAKFLSHELGNIKRPYVMAITAYALALVDAKSSAAHEADGKLKQMAIYDEANNSRHWKADEKMLRAEVTNPSRLPQASAVTVEATSYALLQTLAMKDLSYANAIVKWLTEQRNYGGGFRSTQDTVVALEALSEYSIATFQPEEVDIHFAFSSPSRKTRTILKIQRSNALIQDELKFPLGETINIELSGKGNGTLTILKTYHLLAEPTRTCDYFRLEVSVIGKVDYMARPDYSEYEDYENEPFQADQPLSAMGWFDLRSRRRRQAPDAEKDRAIYYEVCAWHEPIGGKNENISGMAIVDISLLSGFEPDIVDLDKLKNLADRYIDSYEFKDGRVLLYLEMVSEHRECVVFGAKQIIPIGLIQPASATLYDYYNPNTKCTVFYNAPEQSAIVSKLCQNDVCECAEGRCPRIKRTFSSDLAEDDRMNFACYSPIVEYAYEVMVNGVNATGSFIVYKASITKIIKLSSDENIVENAIRHFLKRKSCQIELQIDKPYLLMGKCGKTKDANRNMQYILDSESWIEEMPSERKCKGSRFRKDCEKLHQFIVDLEVDGCQI